MDEKPKQASPVLADSAPNNPPPSKSILGIHPRRMSQPRAVLSKYLTIPRRKPGKFDDVRCNGWLDSMKASSPRKNLLKGRSFDFSSGDADSGYLSWMIKHPSALTSFEKIFEQAKDKKVAVFLDYDGTLSPIVDDPDCALMSDEMRSAVRDVAKCCPTAIISGRSRDKVSKLVGLAELYYAGSHGMDIIGPINSDDPDGHLGHVKVTYQQGKEVKLFQPAREFIPVIDEVFRTLVEITKGIKGAKVENHKFCASVHYRNVDENHWLPLAQRVYDAVAEDPRLRVTHGRKVLEVRPAINWNKGKAVEFLLQSIGLKDGEGVVPIYIGDDKTDEDAFEAVGKGGHGVGILVSAAPRETSASYSLEGPSEVMEFLKRLAKAGNNATPPHH
ncbi:hypothetical protein MLD38_010683 [Melastoma candidum]|uniref:Uncharacterized protein n=1 Tax=Melastoma candidum TaxID=119954 RepID=A0ACB9R903_9MYRT|nr:hypothetical protein MLD38_010683 [Melastoma candidum]